MDSRANGKSYGLNKKLRNGYKHKLKQLTTDLFFPIQAYPSLPQMNEGYPTCERNIFRTQFGDSMMKRSGGLCHIRSDAVHLVIVFEKMFVEAICNFWAIGISNRPEKKNKNTILKPNYSTYHIVATTPPKPANSSVAPRCIASSGRSSSPMAVSHAHRRASDAFGVDSCMIRDI